MISVWNHSREYRTKTSTTWFPNAMNAKVLWLRRIWISRNGQRLSRIASSGRLRLIGFGMALTKLFSKDKVIGSRHQALNNLIRRAKKQRKIIRKRRWKRWFERGVRDRFLSTLHWLHYGEKPWLDYGDYWQMIPLLSNINAKNIPLMFFICLELFDISRCSLIDKCLHVSKIFSSW